MDRLWAPWRLSYVKQPQQSSTGPAEADCFLCSGFASDNDRENLIVRRTAKSFVILNKFPYNNGHLLIAPATHKARFDELDDSELLDLQVTLREVIGVLEKLMAPEGFNVGLNLGRAAGAGLPGHLHWHIVPRWVGDTNFMPLLTDTKVIVQSLDSLQELLRQEWEGPTF